MAKLVDILARELRAWPVDFTHALLTQSVGGRVSYVVNNKERWTAGNGFTRAEDWRDAIVTRTEWQAAVDALNKPDAVGWDGVGLPPVGTFCEFTHNGEGVEGRWVPCTILAYGSRGDFGETVAIQTNDELFEDRGGLSIQNNRQAISWRPIRTPEQIAAEDREKALSAMKVDAQEGKHGPQMSLQNILMNLYDAGYRKQEPK